MLSATCAYAHMCSSLPGARFAAGLFPTRLCLNPISAHILWAELQLLAARLTEKRFLQQYLATQSTNCRHKSRKISFGRAKRKVVLARTSFCLLSPFWLAKLRCGVCGSLPSFDFARFSGGARLKRPLGCGKHKLRIRHASQPASNQSNKSTIDGRYMKQMKSSY